MKSLESGLKRNKMKWIFLASIERKTQWFNNMKEDEEQNDKC